MPEMPSGQVILPGVDRYRVMEPWFEGVRVILSYRAEPPRVPNSGDRYFLGVYRSTHRAGADFLRELAASYPSAAGLLQRAAQAMAGEAEAPNACAELLFPGWELPQQADAARNAQAAALLEWARERYAQAIDDIEGALPPL